MSPPARRLPVAAEPPPAPTSPPPDVGSQHAASHSPAAAATDIADATAHGDADEATTRQEGRPSQRSPTNRRLPSESYALGIGDPTGRPDPSPGESSANQQSVQECNEQEDEGVSQQAAPMPANASDASNPSAHDLGHAPPLAIEALGSVLGDEDEGSGPEQDSDSVMQDEEDMSSGLRLPSGDLAVGSESGSPAPGYLYEPGSVLNVGEPELPEEGWMWSVA